jgi:8-oxo-dGTP pyrophosphatase MutT (NUDIX family)
MKPAKTTGIQYAALPFRLQGRHTMILLITSRDTGRWIIPKGWPMHGKTPPEAAATEAQEEAGLVGEIAHEPIGSYRYLKRRKDEQIMAVQVIVFPLRVSYAAPDFKEEGQRASRWFRYRDAANMVAEPSLRRLIRDFGAAQAPNVFMRGLRSYQTWRFGRA